MTAMGLMFASAAILLGLGGLHLVFTFWGNRLRPRDPSLPALMRESSLVLTSETDMWRAWVGFNASHSMGAILFGLIYGYLSLKQPALLFGSPFLLSVGALMLAGYALLGKFYWFSVPFTGICLSCLCYLAACLLK